ncbi:hypothetical protein V1520DRAFT_354952 [Lipomyces starkeyi]
MQAPSYSFASKPLTHASDSSESSESSALSSQEVIRLNDGIGYSANKRVMNVEGQLGNACDGSNATIQKDMKKVRIIRVKRRRRRTTRARVVRTLSNDLFSCCFISRFRNCESAANGLLQERAKEIETTEPSGRKNLSIV